MGFDETIAKLPGSIKTKGFILSCTIAGLLAIPVFTKGSGKEGHDYLSSDKPEAIRTGQEQLRKKYYQQQQQLKEQQQQQQQQQQLKEQQQQQQQQE